MQSDDESICVRMWSDDSVADRASDREGTRARGAVYATVAANAIRGNLIPNTHRRSCFMLPMCWIDVRV